MKNSVRAYFQTYLQLAQALGEVRLGIKDRIGQVLLQARVLGDQLVQPLHVGAHRAQRRVQLLGLQLLLLGAGDRTACVERVDEVHAIVCEGGGACVCGRENVC